MKISKILILSAAALSLAACGEHTHSFGDAWKSDDTSHWHECECGEKSDEANHLDTNTDGKCDVCDHDMEVPSPTGTEVTSSEWVAAFGVNKPYYIADNYKMDVEMDAGGQTMATTIWVDGLKLKALQTQGIGADETYYNEIVDGQKYQYQFDEGTSKWTKNETSRSVADGFANFLEPFGASYTSFTFDNVAETYKCSSLSFGGHLFTNLSINFINKKIAEISLSSVMEDEGHTPFTMTFEITYGGQTVTLPDIPQPSSEQYKVNETQFNAAFTLEGLSNVTITTSSGSFSQTCEADGTKEFNVNMKPYDFYLNKENGVMYEYKQEDDKWVKNQKEGTTYSREDLIRMFGNVYNQLTYDNDSNSYKGTNISIEGAVRYSEVEYCFENLKVVAINGSSAGQSMTVNFTKYGQTVVTLPEVDPEPVPPGPSPSTGYTVTREEYESAISVEAFNNVSVYDTNEYLCYKFDGDNEEVFIYGHAILSHEDDTWYIYTESGGSWSRAVTQNPQSEREDLVYLLSSFDYDFLEYDETSHSYICLDESILSNFGMTYAAFGFEDGVLLYWIMGNQQSSSGMIFTAYGTTAIDIPTVE